MSSWDPSPNFQCYMHELPCQAFMWLLKLFSRLFLSSETSLGPIMLFLFFKDLLFCVYAHVYVCVCVGKWRRPEEGVSAPGACVTGSCELSNTGTELESTREQRSLNHWPIYFSRVCLFCLFVFNALFLHSLVGNETEWKFHGPNGVTSVQY